MTRGFKQLKALFKPCCQLVFRQGNKIGQGHILPEDFGQSADVTITGLVKVFTKKRQNGILFLLNHLRGKALVSG